VSLSNLSPSQNLSAGGIRNLPTQYDRKSASSHNVRTSSPCDVAIIGAGPYGLSIAAHLRERAVDFRIFGKPMETWLEHMPKGMHLKSEGFASSLYDPNSAFTLAEYCKQRDIPYADIGLPTPLEVFASYGLEFQMKFVPGLEKKLVSSVRRAPAGFEISLEDGETFVARKVVAAVGITHFAYVPATLSGLAQDLVSHSSQHSALDHFRGRKIAVIGAGASAVDLAALLNQAGAEVELVSRRSTIHFHSPPSEKPWGLRDHLRHPRSGIGVSWETFFCTHAPGVFRLLPEWMRLEAVKKILGPAPGWFIKEAVVGKVPFNLGFNVEQATTRCGKVNLELCDGSGSKVTLSVDHVIAATGYEADVDRLQFLDPEIRSRIRRTGKAPRLSSHFESSVPGLFFAGPASANAFGPLMRFAFGAGFAARRISKRLA
jgi:thioredoxin reductase